MSKSSLPVIAGYSFSRHAMERAIERQVHAKDVEVTLLNGAGVRSFAGNRPNTVKRVGPVATVVVNYVDKDVLTVYRTR